MATSSYNNFLYRKKSFGGIFMQTELDRVGRETTSAFVRAVLQHVNNDTQALGIFRAFRDSTVRDIRVRHGNETHLTIATAALNVLNNAIATIENTVPQNQLNRLTV